MRKKQGKVKWLMENLEFVGLAQDPQGPIKPDNIYNSNYSCKP